MVRKDMKAVALIPARGGSKRLPRKNILPFMGKPMIAHTIEAALASGLFEQVVVSTEDREIADIAVQHGATLAHRDTALATDKATVRSVAADFLNSEQAAGRSYDLLCVLYATAPMRTAEDIQGVYNLIEPGVCHHALAVCEYQQSPHQALKIISEAGDISPMWPDLVAMRSDALPEFVVDNGSTYFVITKDFLKDQNFYASNMRGYKMERWQSVDLDTLEDFEIAQFFAEKYWKNRP